MSEPNIQCGLSIWTAAHQAPLSMGISRQEYRSGLPCSSPGDHPNPGIEPRSPTLQADSLPFELPEKPISWRMVQDKNSVFFRGEHAGWPYCSVTPSVASIQILNSCSMPVWVIWRALCPCLPPTTVEVLDVKALVLVLSAASGIRHQHDGSSWAALCGIRLAHRTHLCLWQSNWRHTGYATAFSWAPHSHLPCSGRERQDQEIAAQVGS